MESAANKGGRPVVGPAVSVAYPEALLPEVDAAAHALPYSGLASTRELLNVLAGLSDQLVSQRDNAQDIEEDRAYRELAGIAYAEQVHTLRATLQDAARALPIAEAERQLGSQVAEAEAARAEGHLSGLVAARAILEAIARMLPQDAHHVRDRSSLDAPQQDLDA
ncbi:hypothetical protein GCM10017562_01310 [Streptomyces roseofulvus]|uniref:hypothetical protein n=1 Tax=Streptomyces roseofulvus TaxID=33902 RepID=UPI0031F9A3AD